MSKLTVKQNKWYINLIFIRVSSEENEMEEIFGSEQVINQNDTRLRILYLYQMLLDNSDEDHPMSTRQIIDMMYREHGIHMHRTTVPSDIALLKAAGVEIMSERKQAWNYYLSDRTFSLPEIKILIDAVSSSKFITEKKSQELIKKLITLTSATNADKLRRTIHITRRVKSDNEKGYYIVDAINEAINENKKISFFYHDYSANKRPVIKNNSAPYTVSPYDLVWDGDFYYVIGFCDERGEIRTFRVDRIKKQPVVLDEICVKPTNKYDVDHYTNEVFRMYATDTTEEVSLICDNQVMKFLIDKFGKSVKTIVIDETHFRANVQVCVSPTFLGWVFGFEGKIIIDGPDSVRERYKSCLTQALSQI